MKLFVIFVLLAIFSTANSQLPLPTCFSGLSLLLSPLISSLLTPLFNAATSITNTVNPCNLSAISIPFNLLSLGLDPSIANLLNPILSLLKLPTGLGSILPIPSPLNTLTNINLLSLLCIIIGLLLGTLPISSQLGGSLIPIPTLPAVPCLTTVNALSCIISLFNQYFSLCCNPCIAAIIAQVTGALITFINGVPAGPCGASLVCLLPVLNSLASQCGRPSAPCTTFSL